MFSRWRPISETKERRSPQCELKTEHLPSSRPPLFFSLPNTFKNNNNYYLFFTFQDMFQEPSLLWIESGFITYQRSSDQYKSITSIMMLFNLFFSQIFLYFLFVCTSPVWSYFLHWKLLFCFLNIDFYFFSYCYTLCPIFFLE